MNKQKNPHIIPGNAFIDLCGLHARETYERQRKAKVDNVQLMARLATKKRAAR